MKLYSFLFFAVTLFTANTHAGMITNHQFKTDDATYYATLDTNTGIEWLRGATKGQSYNEVFARLDTDLKGWRFPTQDEFKNLLTTYYRDLNPLGGGPRIVYELWKTYCRGYRCESFFYIHAFIKLSKLLKHKPTCFVCR